jgi:hypothetical protein
MPEQRTKIVGRRKPYSGGLAGLQGFLELCARLRGDRPFLPRGVYRFKTYEEADEWTLKMLTRPLLAPKIFNQHFPTMSPDTSLGRRCNRR